MTDFADRASEREAIFLEESLAKHQNTPERADSLSHCEDCGSPIPDARRKAVKGCTRCIVCQEYFEHGWP
ncbi:TraR/DksA family transcriptional regulator [Neisseria sp. CP9]|jgi:phage/conjugal plasmid C-4 type zinc finger protein, traR family|uniref:TraR/DksA family transcriptional regulator n=1 Tax=Neisseria TaxID=482 RepID=UPI0008A8A1BD|nr:MULTISPECIES: TraR/DksA family transcriptional regulator [Neisseria]MBF1285498.1 TraR/DksA family transcriptional regulator [Neisseria sp.]OHR76188.1 conjugal transfer protein TraR [Neisseria sp. HMSC70E02]